MEGLALLPTTQMVALQASITPVLRDLMSSSDLSKHQVYMWYIHMKGDEESIHRK